MRECCAAKQEYRYNELRSDLVLCTEMSSFFLSLQNIGLPVGKFNNLSVDTVKIFYADMVDIISECPQ
jgi:hypothetical protein